MEINRTLVIVVTNMRSGSTFVGKMFDQNERVLYVFEPFWPDVDVLGRPWSQKDHRYQCTRAHTHKLPVCLLVIVSLL